MSWTKGFDMKAKDYLFGVAIVFLILAYAFVNHIESLP